MYFPAFLAVVNLFVLLTTGDASIRRQTLGREQRIVMDKTAAPCTDRVMFIIDASWYNTYFEKVRSFLQQKVFADGNFEPAPHRLSIFSHVSRVYKYRHIGEWTEHDTLEKARAGIQQFVPEKLAGMWGAIEQLDKAWFPGKDCPKDVKTNFVQIARADDLNDLYGVSFLLMNTFNTCGNVSVIILGRLNATGMDNLKSKKPLAILKWDDPTKQPTPPNWSDFFWKNVYSCGGPSQLND